MKYSVNLENPFAFSSYWYGVGTALIVIAVVLFLITPRILNRFERKNLVSLRRGALVRTRNKFLKKIDEIFRKRVDYRLEDAPYPEYRVLDAPDTSYYFRCSDRKTWSVSTARVLPGSFLSAMKEVRALVDDGIKSGTAVRDEVICSEENHCQKDGKF